MQKITPFLWFDNQAEEAATFYTSIFKNSRILHVSHYSEAGQEIHQRQPGSVMTVDFELDGQRFTALNGGPIYQFNEAVSFVVNCDSQAEVDEMWEKLSEGGEPIQCGWLKDRFGVSWQVVPTELHALLNDPDPEKSKRVMTALLQMQKIDIDALKQARDG